MKLKGFMSKRYFHGYTKYIILTFTDRLLSIPLTVSIAEQDRFRVGHVVRVALVGNLRVVAKIWVLNDSGRMRHFTRIYTGDYCGRRASVSFIDYGHY